MSDIREDIDLDWWAYGVACAGRMNTYTVIETSTTIIIEEQSAESGDVDGTIR